MDRAAQNLAGLVIARHILDVMKAAALVFLGTEYGASAADEVMLCAAVYVGQAEGRMMTAGKLAEYVGMPRPTVVRKLRGLKQRGVVDCTASGHWGLATYSPEIASRLQGGIDALLPLIHKASAKLSKLDGGRIAAHDPARLERSQGEAQRNANKKQDDKA